MSNTRNGERNLHVNSLINSYKNLNKKCASQKKELK